MTKSSTLILADDLTGANDTAIQFKKYGCSTIVVTHIVHASKMFLNDYEVVAINTDSRRMNPEDAYHVTYQAVKMFETAKNKNFVYKKVDSMLRGNPGEELAAVMDALEIPLALAAPAFPANRSTLAHGFLPSGADAVQIFAVGSGRNTENIPLETIRQGATFIAAFIHCRNSNGTQIFVADAENDADLKTIYAASSCLGKPHVLAGSAGLANQIARNSGKAESINFKLPSNAVIAGLTCNPKTLVIAGSRQRETATQMLALSQSLSIPIIRFKVSLVMEGKTDEAIKMVYDEAEELMQHNNSVCMIAVESMFQDESVNQQYTECDEWGKHISGALGILTKRLFDGFHFSLLISTGGDTSMGICQNLGIAGIEPLKEIDQGIPLARIVGGTYSGRFMITKSGRFGEADALVKIFDYINE